MHLTQALADHYSFMELTDSVRKQCQAEDFSNFFVISRSLWERRNKKIYENLEIGPKQVIKSYIQPGSVLRM